jgi:hypothetical protein
MPDVSFQALTADTAPRHSTKEALLGLTGVIAIDVTWGYALEHMDLYEHDFLLLIR